MRCGPHLHRHLAPLAERLMASRGFRLGIGREQQSRNRGYRGQGFTPESQRGNGLEVFDSVDLAGRMPRQRKRKICLGNPGAVIADA